MKRNSKHISSRNFPQGFTLVELLVVISIIALLMGILMPALQKARELAKRLLCGNDYRQIVVASLSYATDNDGRLYSLGKSIANYVPASFSSVNVSTFDLIGAMKGYLGDDKIAVWLCPESGGLPIRESYDYSRLHPNAQDSIWTATCYFPGTYYPQFDDAGPTALRLQNAKPDQPLAQDYTTDLGEPYNEYRYMHGRGVAYKQPRPARAGSSYSNKTSSHIPVKRASDVYGTPIAFYDGSAKWVGMNELVRVGCETWGAAPAGTVSGMLSVMPSGFTGDPYAFKVNIPAEPE